MYHCIKPFPYTSSVPLSSSRARLFAEKMLTPDGGTMPLFWLAASLILCVHHCLFRKCKYAANPAARAQTSSTFRGGTLYVRPFSRYVLWKFDSREPMCTGKASV